EDHDDERGTGFIGDFGISRVRRAGETVTETGDFFGSPDYVAPEQIEGLPVDERTDVYALGGVLNFILTGQPPFPRDNDLAKLFAHANAPPPRPSRSGRGVPRAIDGVVAKAMAKRPDDRHESTGELADAAAAALGVGSGGTSASGVAAGSRRGALVGVVAAVLAMVIGIAVAIIIVSGSGGGSGSSVPQATVAATIKFGHAPNAVAV